MDFSRSAGMAAAVVAVVALSGCSRSVSALEARSPPQPLAAAPLEPVQSTELAPPGGQLPGGDPYGTQTASIDPVTGEPIVRPGLAPAGDPLQGSAPGATASLESTGEPLSREALAGTWTVNSDNPDCRIILAFTKWSGGYRAATRRCSSSQLTAITAWDVKDNSVILVDGDGNTVASLYSTGAERYEGSTITGSRVSLSR